MAKTPFWFILIAFLVDTSLQQLPQRQLEAFRSSLQIGSLQTTARRLSNAIAALLAEAQREYTNSTIKGRDVIVSALNDAIREPMATITKAQVSVDSTQNSAAKACVKTALVSINTSINSGIRATYDCVVKTSIRLFNFATRVTSLDVGPTSRLAAAVFGAASECPPSFLIDSLEDLDSAKKCYAEAAAELRNYIEKTTKAFNELKTTLDVLQQNMKECHANGSAVALISAQRVVDTLVSCSRAAGVLIMSTHILNAINEGVSKIEEFVANSKANMVLAALTVNSTLAAITDLTESIDTDIENAMNETLNQIISIGRITKNANESTCLNEAKTKYNKLKEIDITQSKNCVAATIKILTASPLTLAEKRLNLLLFNASDKAVSKCTSPALTVVTVESVTKCFDDALTQLKRVVKPVIQVSEFTLYSTESLVSSAQRCVQDKVNHASLGGKGVLNMMAVCLLQHGVQFLFNQKY